MTITTRNAASAKEALAILQSLLPNGKFEYHGYTVDEYDVDKMNRNFYGYNEHGVGGYRMSEIVVGGKLDTVRFANLFSSVIVDIKIEVNEVAVKAEADIDDYAVSTEAQEAAVEAEIEAVSKPEVEEYAVSINSEENTVDTKAGTKMTVETKIAKNGAKLYYVDGKRVSRDKALEVAADSRDNLFTVEYETRDTAYFVNGPIQVSESTNKEVVKELKLKIDEYHGFTVQLRGAAFASLHKFYNKEDAKTLVNKIEDAFIKGEHGVKIDKSGKVTILTAEVKVDDYAASTEAQEAAVEAEIELANKPVEVIAEDDGSNDDPDDDDFPTSDVTQDSEEEDDDELVDPPEDTTPYKVKISMYGNKTPMFSIKVNGKALRNKSWRKKEVDEWVMRAYEEREQHPNIAIEIPEVVAVLHLDSFACNPRIVRELNVSLTEFKMADGTICGGRKKALDKTDVTEITPEILTKIEPYLKNSDNVRHFKQEDCDKWKCEGQTFGANKIYSIAIKKFQSHFNKVSFRYGVVLRGSNERWEIKDLILKYFDNEVDAEAFLENMIRHIETAEPVEVDDFDYVEAEEHINSVYDDVAMFIGVCSEKHGLTQEQSEQIYIALHINSDFSNIDYALRDKLIEQYKKINAGILAENMTLEVTAKTSKNGLVSYYLDGKRASKEKVEREMSFAAGGGNTLVEGNGHIWKRQNVVIKVDENLLKNSFQNFYSNIENGFLFEAEVVYTDKMETKAELPSGDITVASGAEAFKLVEPYFPLGLEFDGLDGGYRGETHFCFYNESADMSLIAASDESNCRIEYLQIVNHKANSVASFEERHPLTVRIEPNKSEFKPVVEASKVEKNSEPKKQSAKNASQKTSATDKSERWLENAKVDETGKYYVVPELSYKNFAEKANWNPCFYILTNDMKLRRIGLKFAVKLAALGQAIEISKAEMATLRK